MGHPADDHAGDPPHRGDEGMDGDRAALDAIFKAGGTARRDGIPLRDNPYAAGSAEREEWDAGWCATVELDDSDSDCGYQKN